MAVSITQFDELKCKVDDHDHFINGNSKPGAKERFNTIEIKLNAILWVGGILGSVMTAYVVYFITDFMPRLYSLMATIK